MGAEAEADPQLLISQPANFYTAGSVVSPVNSVLYNAVKPAAAAVTYTKPVVTAAASTVVNPVVYKTAVNPVVYKTPVNPDVYKTAVNPVVYKTAVNPVVYNTAAHPVHLTNGVNSYANSVGAVHVTKREAEAEAEADPAVLYSTAGVVFNKAPAAVYTSAIPTTTLYNGVHNGV